MPRLTSQPSISPVPYGTVIRAIRTPMVEHWGGRRDEARASPDEVVSKLAGSNRGNLPVSGQSAGGIQEILPAQEIVRRLAQEAEDALRSTDSFFKD